jgi:hypothetical protein
VYFCDSRLRRPGMASLFTISHLGKTTSVLPSIQRSVHNMDSNRPLENPVTQQAVFEQSYSQQRMFARLSSFFGLLAALLVAIGTCGTPAYRMNRRMAEIGVRPALVRLVRGCCGWCCGRACGWRRWEWQPGWPSRCWPLA